MSFVGIDIVDISRFGGISELFFEKDERAFRAIISTIFTNCEIANGTNILHYYLLLKIINKNQFILF